MPIALATVAGATAAAAVYDALVRRIPLWISLLALAASLFVNPWAAPLGVVVALIMWRFVGMRIGGADVIFSAAIAGLSPWLMLAAWSLIIIVGLASQRRARLAAVPIFALMATIALW